MAHNRRRWHATWCNHADETTPDQVECATDSSHIAGLTTWVAGETAPVLHVAAHDGLDLTPSDVERFIAHLNAMSVLMGHLTH